MSVENTGRDDRTVRLLKNLLGRADLRQMPHQFMRDEIILTLDRDAAVTPGGQILYLVLVDLVVRFARRVVVDAPDSPLLVPHPMESSQNIRVAASQIVDGLNVEKEPTSEPTPTQEKGRCLVVRVGSVGSSAGELWVAAREWAGGAGWHDVAVPPWPRDSQGNPLGAMVAACLGASEVFAWLLGRPGKTKQLSAFSYTTDDPLDPPHISVDTPLSLGHIALVGVGAVGMGVCAGLSYFHRLAGHVHLVDPDVVEMTNLNRYVGSYSSNLGQSKVTVAADRLSRTGLNTSQHLNTFHRARAHALPDRISTAVVTIDNVEDRWNIQASLPRLILNGATAETLLSVSRHDFLEDACLACIYPPNTDPLAFERDVSSASGLPLQDILLAFRERTPFTREQAQAVATKAGINPESLIPLVGRPFPEVWAEYLCAQLPVPAKVGQPPAASISFVSCLAGVLLTSELIKSSFAPQSVLQNFFHMDVLHGLHRRSLQTRGKDPRCVLGCSTPAVRKAFQAKWTT